MRCAIARSQPRDSVVQSQKNTDCSRKKTIPASEVGVTLTISDEALKEIERIQEETIKAAQEDQKFAWR